MKPIQSVHQFKIVITIICLLSIDMAVGQNVGIGTAAPLQKLHVAGGGVTIRVDGLAGIGTRALFANANGDLTVTAGVPAPMWMTLGNAGLTDGTHFLGTTDGRRLDFRTNNSIRATFTSTGWLGIGLVAPAYMFHMRSATTGANTAMAQYENQSVNGVALSAYNTSSTSGYNGFEGISNYSQSSFIASGAFGLAINNTLTSIAIGVRGHANNRDGSGVRGARVGAAGTGAGFGGLFLSDLGYSGGFYLVSDERLKKDVTALQSALHIVNQLKPVQYHYNTDAYPYLGLNTSLEFGLIAQDLEKVLPNLVAEKLWDINACKSVFEHQNESAEMRLFKSVDYTRLIPVLIAAIQEQQVKMEALEQELNEIKNKK